MFINPYYRSPYAPSSAAVLLIDFTNTSSISLSGSLITQATNQGSGVGMNVTSAGAQRPTYGTGANGVRFAAFDGIGNELVTGATNLLRNVSGATIYVNRKWTALPPTDRPTFFVTTSTSVTRARLIGTATGFNAVGGRTLNADSYIQLTGSIVPLTTTTWNVHTAVFDYANTDLYQFAESVADGSNLSFQTATTTSNTATGACSIGSLFGATYANVAIAQVLVFNTAHNGGVRFSIENWMRYNSPT